MIVDFCLQNILFNARNFRCIIKLIEILEKKNIGSQYQILKVGIFYEINQKIVMVNSAEKSRG